MADEEGGSEPCPAGTLRKSPMEMDLRCEGEGKRRLDEDKDVRTSDPGGKGDP